MNQPLVHIVYKRIKNANIKVKPTGEVILTVPFRVGEKEIANILEKRATWINEKLNYFKNLPEQIVDYRSGEKVQFLGHDYELNIIESSLEKVEFDNKRLHLYVKIPHDSIRKKRILDLWYKEQASHYYKVAIDKYIGFVNKSVNSVTIRNMKTRWGSCNQKKGYINLNLALIKQPLVALEYVVFHELTHLLFYHHDKSFYGFIEKYMPDWKLRRSMLNAGKVD